MAEKDFSKMDADELKDIQDTLENQSMTSAVAKIQDDLTKLDNEPLNIAVTGESGSGKSTFINAFRGLGHEEPNSAPTGSVETTLEPKEYSHPKYPNVKLWDLPGIGTPTFKADQYLKAVQFERYDFFIIVAADRFRECHGQLISKIQKMKKNFYFLRNKIDANIAAERESKPNTFNEEKTLETIRKDCIKGLEEINAAGSGVFLISCLKLGLFDFNLLHDAIEKELPEQKRHVLLLALPNITMEVNQKKKTALEKNIWKVALLSSAAAAVPIPCLSFTVDAGILLTEINKYRKAFGLDDESLQKLAEISNVSVKELKAQMKYTPDMKFNATGVAAQLITFSTFALVEESAESLVRLMIPIIGSVIAAGMSFATTRYLLNKYLEEIATDAHNILMKAMLAVREEKQT